MKVLYWFIGLALIARGYEYLRYDLQRKRKKRHPTS